MIFLVLLLSCGVTFCDNFINSFVTSYDVFPQGRYSRGYPNYLAEKSKESLVGLEQAVSQAGFDIVGRMIISGYEQNAVPSYKFSVEQKNINDEASVKGNSGWSFAPGNMFGFTTGFLFKDCNSFPANTIFQHIGHNRIEIFADNAEVLQKNAFGGSFNIINDFKRQIEKNIVQGSSKKVIDLMIEYWKNIYAAEKDTHDFSIVATQDILFSIMYATYLSESPITIRKFFTGPDITYPIRVLPIQPLEATLNSQEFLQKFVSNLTPVDDQDTAYIFCSFVDGVGKSTLLGNIINWLKFDKNFKAYEAVNNSSSQLATIYQCAPKTCIVDLPAQISHYCAKPDGYVFVDINSCSLQKDTYEKIFEQIGSLEKLSIIVKNVVHDLLALKEGALNTEHKNVFYIQYLKNILLLGVQLKWVPFVVDDKVFVIDIQEQKLRVLVSFDEAHSTGLKVREPELMIFDGAVMPMKYENFLSDLTQRLTEHGIKKVVFVDFISMYPRSSRENVRINFMTQQLKSLFNEKFDINKSFYRDFSNNFELYPLLDSSRDQLINNFALEILSRTSLNDCIMQDSIDNINKMSFDDLIKLMQQKLAAMSKKDIDAIYDLVKSKIDHEFKTIEHFKYSKIVESCWHSPLDKIAALSKELQSIFAYKVPHALINTEWSSLDNVTHIDETVTFASGARGHIVMQIAQDSHATEDIEKLASLLRVTYYGTIISLLTDNAMDKVYPPIIIIPFNGHYLVVQKYMENCSLPLAKCVSVKPYKQEYLYGLDFESSPNVITQLYFFIKNPTYGIIDEKISGEDFFVRTSVITDLLDKYDYWNYIEKGSSAASYIAHDHETLALLLRSLATIDVLIKHPKSEIMAMYNSQHDFIASLQLIENVWLKYYIGLALPKNLFDNYHTVEPIVPLEWKENS